MTLQLKDLSLHVQGETYLDNIDAHFERGSFNVLLGRNLAGKTSLLRLMAGLDRATTGQLIMDGKDVTGLPVQQRKVSMVYQQFINYPNMSVYENIASPLRIASEPQSVIDKKVKEVAELLHIEDYLQRRPLELSGGQQQRTSMARALVKGSDLILFDEPLVNLDYKLREELRTELRSLLKERDTIAVYASSDPAEALAFGGDAVVLHEGRIIQIGDVADLYRKPTSIECAELLSEPPINLLNVQLLDNAANEPSFMLESDQRFTLSNASRIPRGDYRVGLRPHHLRLSKTSADDVKLDLTVDVAELSGSETYLHLSNGLNTLVAQLKGVLNYSTNTAVNMFFSPADLYLFDASGRTVHFPKAQHGQVTAMSNIHLKSLAHSYKKAPQDAQDYAIRELDHVWEQGGAYALLGPSGCGKSTLLNIISGLLQPSAGEVLFDGQTVTHLTPQERNIAQVFQFPVVYDSMTVYDNLAFPLRNLMCPKDQIEKRVKEVAAVLELEDVLDRRANNLSADAKQKISMGRGLVREDVSAILFDEPLTVIDPHLKWKLRRKLKQIHERFNITMVYVTHDQLEAATFADKIAVMYEGQIVQFGTPQELFESPSHTFVGYFIGSPGMNLIPVTRYDSGVLLNDIQVPLDSALVQRLSSATSDNIKFGIRPEFVEVLESPENEAYTVAVSDIENHGSYSIVSFELAGNRMQARVEEGSPLPTTNAYVRFPAQWIRIYVDELLLTEPSA